MLLYVRLGSAVAIVLGLLLCGVGALRSSAEQEEWFQTLASWKGGRGFVTRNLGTPDEETATIDHVEENHAGGDLSRVVLSATIDGSSGRSYRRITELSHDLTGDPVVRYEGPSGFRESWVIAGATLGVIGLATLVGSLFARRKATGGTASIAPGVQ